MSRFYITTPIYYVNDHPHIGHIYTTLVADTIARYRRLCGDSVYFLTGTDEHGQNIERAAAKRGIEPIALADEVVSRYHQLWQQLGISHQDFIRTSEERHQVGVEEVIRHIADAGDFYLSLHEGWYCSSCEAFYTEKELVAADGAGNLCPTHRRETEWRSEENLFFRLSKYQDALLELYDRGFVSPESRANEVRQFVASGLRDLSVSRTNVAWAIPFPGHPGHTVYVWLDALTNYISALGYGHDGDLYRRFWEQGGERIHLVGKDILRFHAVYWPAFLMSAKLPLPTKVWAHGWWLRDDHKISKSGGNIVRPDELIESFGTDSLRYF
ncbi:MAG: methionine--tRNA ligase, partial [Thermoanaerobaculia bacterium]